MLLLLKLCLHDITGCTTDRLYRVNRVLEINVAELAVGKSFRHWQTRHVQRRNSSPATSALSIKV